MPNTTLGSAYVQIIPSAEGISGSITGLLKDESKDAGEKSGGIFSSGFAGKVGKGLAVGTAAVAGFSAAASAAIGSAVSKTADFGDHIDKMSQKLGFSTESFQKWDYVLQLSGVSIDNMQGGIKTLTNKLDDAKNGSKSAIASFERIGLSMEELQGMSREDIFGAAIKQLQGMEDSTERAALANDLFGRSGQELTPLLNQSADATAELMTQAERYGMIMSEEAVKASAAFNDSVTTMQMTITGLKNSLMAEFLPSVTQITDGLGKMFAGDMSGLDDVVAGVKDVIENIKALAPKVFEAAASLIKKLMDGILSKAGELGSKAGELLGPLIQKIIAKAPDFINAAVKLIGGLVTGLFNSLPSVASALGKIVGDMVRWLLNGGWKEIGSKILDLVGSGLKSALSALGEIVKSIGTAILEGFGLDTLWQKVKDTVDKIKAFFSFDIQLPHIALPHFYISPAGWKLGDLLKGSIPSLGIEWYAEGGIMAKPTLFGGGEAGPEGIIPLDPFWKRLDKIAESTGNSVVINVYPSSGMDEQAIAEAVERRFIDAQKRRRLAWG